MSEEKPTVKAVIAEAKRLRDKAERQRVQDPYASPYSPTDAAARKLCTRCTNRIRDELMIQHADLGDLEALSIATDEAPGLGAQAALEELSARAMLHERTYREQQETSERARLRHKRKAADAARDRQAIRDGKTLGARADAALAGLALIAMPAASQLDGDIITQSKAGTRDPGFTTGDPASKAIRVIREAVNYAERELEQGHRRVVEEEAA